MARKSNIKNKPTLTPEERQARNERMANLLVEQDAARRAFEAHEAKLAAENGARHGSYLKDAREAEDAWIAGDE